MDNSQISDVSFWSLQYNSLLKCHRKAIVGHGKILLSLICSCHSVY